MAERPDESVSRSEMMRRSNQEVAELWAIDTDRDPYDVRLKEFNPGHPDLFEARKELPYFARLRDEDPVHYSADSQFGPYWSVT